MAKRTAIIDLGSNGIRMAIFEKTSRYGFYILNEQKVKFRLGQGAYDEDNKILDEKIDKAYEIISHFYNQALSYRCKKIFCIGTSALRDAKNKDVLIKKIKLNLKLNIKTISGEEEAYLGGFGAINLLPDFNTKIITLDIGGGSAELCLIDKNKIIKTFSLDLGTVRLKDLFQDKYHKMEEFIKQKLKLIPNDFTADKLITIGGSLRAISSSIMEKNNYPLKQVHNFTYMFENEENYINKIINCKQNELNSFNIKKDRHDTIKIGALVFLKIVKKLNIKQVITSGAGVREGVFLKDLFKKHNSFPVNFNPSLKSLEDRFIQIKTNSLVQNIKKLFYVLKDFHYIDEKYLIILIYAAKLHNVGNSLSFYSKHKHSAYIVLNGLNFKITHADKALISTIIEQHGKKINYNNIKISSLLPNENITNWLNYLLAFSVTLCKNKNNVIYDFYFDGKVLLIENSLNFIELESLLKLSQPKSFKIITKTS